MRFSRFSIKFFVKGFLSLSFLVFFCFLTLFSSQIVFAGTIPPQKETASIHRVSQQTVSQETIPQDSIDIFFDEDDERYNERTSRFSPNSYPEFCLQAVSLYSCTTKIISLFANQVHADYFLEERTFEKITTSQ